MAVKVYGSNLCPATMRFLSILTAHGIMPSFVNVTGSIQLLKEFMLLRDTMPCFDSIRSAHRIGFPMIQLEDGTCTCDVNAVLEAMGLEECMTFHSDGLFPLQH